MNGMLKKIYDEVMGSPLGGDINSDASEEAQNYIVLHCWDGRRFLLSCVQEPKGCAYDANTGKPIK